MLVFGVVLRGFAWIRAFSRVRCGFCSHLTGATVFLCKVRYASVILLNTFPEAKEQSRCSEQRPSYQERLNCTEAVISAALPYCYFSFDTTINSKSRIQW